MLSKKKLLKLYEGVTIDFGKRWEEGWDHHPKSVALFEHLRALDFHCNGDFFDWKVGGDGDNGEELMYALDVYFDRLDKVTND